MNHLIAVITKELLLLRRDRAGLAVLFLMPAVLVLVITLVHQNALSTIGEGRTAVLFIDGDQERLGDLIHNALENAPGVDLTVVPDGDEAVLAEALERVTKGEFQLYLRLPPGTTARVRARARRLAKAAFGKSAGALEDQPPPADIELYFDPTVLGSLRSAVHHLLELMLLRVEVAEKAAALGERLPKAIAAATKEALGPMAAMADGIETPHLDLSWPEAPLVEITEARTEKPPVYPNATQHNVPAWSVFGVFFIVVPMAGTFIKERNSGVDLRLRSLPVAYAILLAGKVGAYLLVCLGQLALIVGIGYWVLPLCGAPAFSLAAAPLGVVIVTAGLILAATTFGIFLGTIVHTYEQAATVGPIAIVVAAAIGGVMVPVYAMPAALQTLSRVSPLGWALDGFMALFVRQGNLMDVTADVALLSAFALACLAGAVGVQRYRQRCH
jgi:ABC-2 type transport system permease protein